MPLISAKGKRSFTYSVIILFILGTFALGYTFYFIPHNRENLHKDGFLILKTITTDISDAADSRATNFSNWMKNGMKNGERSKDLIRSIFKSKGVEQIDIQIKLKDSNFTKLQITTDKVIVSIDTSDFKDSTDSRKWKNFGDSSIQVSQSLDQFFSPVINSFLSSANSEFFESYTLEKINQKTSIFLYQDTSLGFRSDVADSLLPKGSGSFAAGIRDMTTQNVSMKMFYYPFTIDGSSFVLSGFVAADKYADDIKKIPFYFVYPLIIIFLLGIIFFPLIKFYMMDSNEPLRTKDVIFFAVSTILGASLLTILIIQFLLWKGEEIRVANNLKNISGQIQNAFNTELKKVFAETEALDEFKMQHFDSVQQKTFKTKNNISDSVRSFLMSSNNDTSGYFHFDRISWVDDNGEQSYKAELHGAPVFTNVASRNYVQVFKKEVPYFFDNAHKEFGWEPIYSWTNNEFNISISLRLRDKIVAMATKMYSLVNTILPAGYGFCIVDEDGNAQVHSDGNRSLRENFLQKTDKPNALKDAIVSRQSKIINYVMAYGRLHMMRVEPLHKSMPFYLISFYDEGYINPVNLRILIFTLLLSIVFFAVCRVVWWLLTIKKTSWPMIYCKMDFLDWIIPKSKEGNYYYHGFIYTVVYVSSILALIFLNRYYEVGNFNILNLLIATPINIILVLYCMRVAFNPAIKQRNIFKMAIIHLIISLMTYIIIKESYSSLTPGFLIFQMFINAIMWIYGFTKPDSRLLALKSKRTFLTTYKLLITSLVICLAVLPASLFTWYAHNQELTQTVKRQQLYLANQIRQRNFLIQDQKQFGKDWLPLNYFDSLRLSYGIYKIHNDKIEDTCKQIDDEKKTGFENFYFDLAEKLSTPYYKEQSYTALQDTADDLSWHWVIKDTIMHFWYQVTLPRTLNRQVPSNCLHIASVMPARFVYLTKGKILPLILIIVLLVIGLYKWLGKNAEQIFLTRFIYLKKKVNADKHKEYFASFFAKWPLSDNERLYTPAPYKSYSTHCDANTLLEYEQQLVDDLKNGKELYTHVWNDSTEKEKFLLYGFAIDGIVNYKNSKEIIELMNRGVLVVEDERLRLFSPGFRAFILYSVEEKEIIALQKQHRQNSTWHYLRIPFLILLLGIAALIFFTQQGVFDKILVLAGGVSTLIGLVTRFFSGNLTSKKE